MGRLHPVPSDSVIHFSHYWFLCRLIDIRGRADGDFIKLKFQGPCCCQQVLRGHPPSELPVPTDKPSPTSPANRQAWKTRSYWAFKQTFAAYLVCWNYTSYRTLFFWKVHFMSISFTFYQVASSSIYLYCFLSSTVREVLSQVHTIGATETLPTRPMEAWRSLWAGCVGPQHEIT